MKDPYSSSGIVGEHDAQYGHKKEEKRKQCDKHCVSELHREISGIVISELLDYAQDERWNEVTLLRRVNSAKYPF